MTETVDIAELRANLGDYLRRVEEGERFVVMEGDHPVVEMAPPRSRLDQLIAEGKVRPPLNPGGPLPEPLPMNPDDPNALSRALEEVRGYR
jgi:antitoxin (DNA-binding transcriptional repressor) of toxin-antitoxin stability system